MIHDGAVSPGGASWGATLRQRAGASATSCGEARMRPPPGDVVVWGARWLTNPRAPQAAAKRR
eukprot:11161521-Lingulodinium_polyedra.AAC.1